MKVYNMNPSSIYTGLKDEIDVEVGKLMPKSGGTFTDVVQGMTAPVDASPQLRNVVIVDAGTNIDELSVPAGTIVMVRK